MTTGAIYVAVGEGALAEAVASAGSLKAIHPALQVTVFTNLFVVAPCFNSVVPIGGAESGYRKTDKMRCMARSPYDLTLYLDADTHVCGDLSGLFVLLERFDLAAAHGLNRIPSVHLREPWRTELADIPDEYCLVNSGVVAFKKSPSMGRFFEDWAACCARDGQRGAILDQAGFREALYRSDLSVWVLPNEYNCQSRSCGFLSEPVKILHGHQTAALPGIASVLNRQSGRRIYYYEHGRLTVLCREGGRTLTLRLEPLVDDLKRRVARKLGGWKAILWKR